MNRHLDHTPPSTLRSRRLPRCFVMALALLLVPMAGALTAKPTVDGLFYGDDGEGADSEEYVRFATSFYGSRLYVYYDAPSTALYVALVVNRSVNDNVFGADDFAGYSGDYMGSAGWGQGTTQQRGASRLVDSEFASFGFGCVENSPREWGWQQGYACLQNGTWVSDSSCGTSAVITNGFPPSLRSASSFAWNINTYSGASPKPWNRDAFGSTLNDWRSPYSFSNPNTVPPNNPNTVIGLSGYPAPTNSGDLSQGPPITHNATYEYEWPMVYEWSIDLGPGGTNCQANELFLLAGSSHHSPMKAGVEGSFDDACGAENDCFSDDPDPNPLSDFGDLPSTYGTLTADDGPRHYITIAGPYLGSSLQIELDGAPTGDATGDGPEEDGVVAVDGIWTVGSTQSFEVEVVNGPALLGGWLDWNNDGDFDDAGEFYSWNVTTGTNTLDVTVGSGFDWQSDDLYARFRIFSSGSAAPGGSLDSSDSLGVATDGEVEDYQVTVEAPIQVSIDDVGAFEGDAGTTPFDFTVTLNRAVQGGFTVDFTTVDGSATTADGDYVATSGTLDFDGTEGETQTIPVDVLGDLTVEPDEAFTVELSNLQPTGLDVTIADPAGLGSIEDDDAIKFRADVVGTKEVTGGTLARGGTVRYTVVLTNLGPGLQQDNPSNELEDVLPPELVLISATADAGTTTVDPGADTVTWNGEIPAGERVTITIEAAILEPTPRDSAIANQGTISYDADGFTTNEASRLTDDPATSDPEDPTVFRVGAASVLEIPVLDEWALWLLALLLATGGLVALRR